MIETFLIIMCVGEDVKWLKDLYQLPTMKCNKLPFTIY